MDGTFRESLDAPWLGMNPVIAGVRGRVVFGGPDAYVTFGSDEEPVLRVDVHDSEPACYAFQDAILWGGLAIVGFGRHVHLVWIATSASETIELDGYFGHLYPLDAKRLLVADATSLHCFDAAGTRLWTRRDLAIDGVVVGRVAGEVIEGDGEWDPPGGWQPFRVQLADGKDPPDAP